MFAAPRGLSQLTASFVALRCQGIHRAPFRACAFLQKLSHRSLRTGFASILTEVAASRPPRSGSQLFASKPRARFDCLEIELLMSSHSNFSRLPLSKIVEIDRGTAFRGWVVGWFGGLVVGTAKPPNRQTGKPKLVGVTGVEPVTFTLSV